MDSLSDGTSAKRNVLLASVESAMKFGKSERSAKESGLISLFGDMEEVGNAIEFQLNTSGAKEVSRNEMLDWEKELLGFYLSKHPLAYLVDALKDRVKYNVGQIGEEHARQKVKLGGMITEARRITTKKGDTMCIARIEDMYSSISVTVFPRAYEQNPELWTVNNVLVISGEVQVRNDEPTILCEKAELFEGLEEEINRKQYDVWIIMQLSGEDDWSVSNDRMRVQDLYNCIHNQPGRDHYQFLVMNGEWQVRLTPTDNTMHFSDQVRDRLVGILQGMGEVKAQLVER